MAMSCKRLYFISGMDVINDLCICVLHLNLWMLALIQGLALQSKGSIFLYKGGILQMRKRLDVVRSLGWDPVYHEEIRNGPENKIHIRKVPFRSWGMVPVFSSGMF